MRRAVIADTGPLYAAVDPDDNHHKQAHKELERLTGEKRDIVVVYATLLEAYTLVLFRLGNKTALRWLDDMAEAALVNHTAQDYRQAAIRVRGMPDQRITLFDAIVAGMSVRLDIPVWTYDHHFDLMRVKVWR